MRFAVLAPWHGRHEATLPLIRRVMVESTRPPDEFWVVVEDADDWDVALDALDTLNLKGSNSAGIELVMLPTPRTEKGTYEIVPYSAKINLALNRTTAEIVTYLDNSSVPGVHKYAYMDDAMTNHPGWGGCYVTQQRTGFAPAVYAADEIVPNGHCQLNYTAICHKVTADRWSTNMAHANPDLIDAMFMADLSKSIGPLYPCGGSTVHDLHHIESPAAAGI